MHSWNTYFLLGWPIFRGELFVLPSVFFRPGQCNLTKIFVQWMADVSITNSVMFMLWLSLLIRCLHRLAKMIIWYTPAEISMPPKIFQPSIFRGRDILVFRGVTYLCTFILTVTNQDWLGPAYKPCNSNRGHYFSSLHDLLLKCFDRTQKIV